MDHLYYDSVMPLQPVLRAMTARGIKRDELATFKASLGVKKISASIEQQLRNVVGQSINLDSPKQLSKLLYEDMGLPVQMKRDKKRGMIPTVDDNALDALERLTNNKIFALINKRRKFNKLDSTYFSLEADDQGYIHPKFGSAKAADPREKEKGSGARNGRLVSWNPNFQNQPLDVRELYIPDHPDHVFIEADWSQVEWRTAMVDSGEPYGLSVLASGADNHSIVAAECFGLTLAQVAAEDAKYSGGWGSPRFASKFIIYGLGYGRGAQDIAKQLGKDVAWVQGFIARFKSRLPVYWQWRADLEGFVAKNNYLRNFIGRRRWWYTKQVTEMYNYPPSSTAADMMYLVLPQLERELPNGATLRLTVHDSVLINAPRDGIRQTVQCIKDVMQRTWPEIVDFSKRPENVKRFYPNGWYCPADIHLGNNWKECKKGNKALEKELLS
jgi:DNA polymerase-1